MNPRVRFLVGVNSKSSSYRNAAAFSCSFVADFKRNLQGCVLQNVTHEHNNRGYLLQAQTSEKQ